MCIDGKGHKIFSSLSKTKHFNLIYRDIFTNRCRWIIHNKIELFIKKVLCVHLICDCWSKLGSYVCKAYALTMSPKLYCVYKIMQLPTIIIIIHLILLVVVLGVLYHTWWCSRFIPDSALGNFSWGTIWDATLLSWMYALSNLIFTSTLRGRWHCRYFNWFGIWGSDCYGNFLNITQLTKPLKWNSYLSRAFNRARAIQSDAKDLESF